MTADRRRDWFGPVPADVFPVRHPRDSDVWKQCARWLVDASEDDLEWLFNWALYRVPKDDEVLRRDAGRISWDIIIRMVPGDVAGRPAAHLSRVREPGRHAYR